MKRRQRGDKRVKSFEDLSNVIGGDINIPKSNRKSHDFSDVTGVKPSPTNQVPKLTIVNTTVNPTNPTVTRTENVKENTRTKKEPVPNQKKKPSTFKKILKWTAITVVSILTLGFVLALVQSDA